MVKVYLRHPFDRLYDDNSALLVVPSIPVATDHATAIVVFPLTLTQGAKKPTSDAHEARIADSRKAALRPSM